MGFKTFNAGDVLTASDVNDYLMKQTVIVCTSGTRPSSPVDGMTIYETDTDRILVYNGSAWIRVGWNGTAGRTGGTWRRAVNQSVPNITLTAISWDTEDADSDGFCTPTSSTITIPSGLGGLYAVSCYVGRPANNGSNDYIEVVCSTLGTFRSHNIANLANMTGPYVAFGPAPLAAAETIQVRVYQSTGGAINYTGRIELYRLGI